MNLRHILLLCLGLAILTGTASAQAVHGDVAMRYLNRNAKELGLTGADLAGAVITDLYTTPHNGVTHIYIQQTFGGIPVFGGQINLGVTSGGAVISAAGEFIPGVEQRAAGLSRALSAGGAVESAARHLGLDLTAALSTVPRSLTPEQARRRSPQDVLVSTGGISEDAIPVDLLYLPDEDGSLRLVWRVGINTTDGQHMWLTYVDASTGVVVRQDDLVTEDRWDAESGTAGSGFFAQYTNMMSSQPMVPIEFALPTPATAPPGGGSYRVIAAPFESPSHVGDPFVDQRVVVNNPANAAASPLGWHSTGVTAYTVTRGNNVHAYTDTDGNNIPDPGSDPDGGPGLVFDFAADFTQGAQTYREAAVTNLFYWNNVIHDVMYQYGFNEAAGNFQVNNFGNGGLGNDDVRAEAQDGSGTNNANFGTPVDGARPRMQMFLWTGGASSLTVNAPAAIAGTYVATGAAFGPTTGAAGLTGDVVAALDGAGASTTDACEPLINGADVAGNIALIDRGSCTFVIKVKNAQNAGAIGVLMANNVGGNPITMGGTDPTITIPSVMVSMDDGALIRTNLPANVTLTSVTFPTRDSDFDNGVIVHEYGHGISNRLTGGPGFVGALGNQEQMGEGWSDYFALLLTGANTDPRGIGTYVSFQPPTGPGIRSYPYSRSFGVNPFTYDDIKTQVIPHGVGSVWATMLWDMTGMLVDRYGFDPNLYSGTGGNNRSLRLVTDGLKMQPVNPGFVDGRNAILAADVANNGSANQCLIWDAFSRRGLGFSASQGSPFSVADGVQAFDLPISCCNVAQMRDKLLGLQGAGKPVQGLLDKLAAYELKIAQGQPMAALNILNAFAKEVKSLKKDKYLTEAEVEDIMDCYAGLLNRANEFPEMRTAHKGAEGALADAGELPMTFDIDQNYPNPFNPVTSIRFAVPEAAHVRISVYDVMGRRVAELANGEYGPGYHDVLFDATGLASGTYLYRMEAGRFVQVRRMVVLK